MRFLTVDLGNSRCKLRLWTLSEDRAPALHGETEFPSTPGLGALAASWVGEGDAPDAAAVCSVAGDRLEDELARALR